MKKTIFASGLTGCFLLLAFCGNLLAQGSQPTSPAKILPCDEAVKMATADAQAKANAECRTIHYCVECMDKTSQICKPVTANPTCPNTGVVSATTKTTAAAATKVDNKVGAASVPADAFEVIIVQSVCYKGGVSIEPFVPGMESVAAKDRMASAKSRQSRYSFNWIVDGKKMGESTRLECVCGKEAILTATETATKKTVTKAFKLPETCGGGTEIKALIPSPTKGGINEGDVVLAFKRTSCYGTCPAYEVKFYNNGTASWDGYMHVARMGHFETTLGPGVIAKLHEKAAATKFFELNTKYPTGFSIADAPSTITYVRAGGKEMQVENTLDAPKNLIEFENFIYDEIVKMGWKADPPTPKIQEVKAVGSEAAPKH